MMGELATGPGIGPAYNAAFRWLSKLGLLIAGYVVFTGLIFAFEAAGQSLGVRRLGTLGLALDIGILTLAVTLLGRRGSPLAGTLGPLLGLCVVVLFFALADWTAAWWFDRAGGQFWSLRNLRTVGVQTSTVAVAALGMTMIIIAGGIDLSAGTALALCATVLAYGLKEGVWIGIPGLFSLSLGSSVWIALAAAVLTGCICGLFNGALISCLRVVPFIITLGTMTVFLGVAKIVAQETTVRPPLATVPDWLPAMVRPVPSREWLAYPLLPNFGWGVWLAIFLAILLACLLHFSVFGRHVFALGSNEATARLCGINVPLTRIAVYTLAGAFVGVAGVYQFARLSSGNPTSGIGLELKIIAAVVIGGGSLNGGRGSVVGTLTGAAIMLVIASGCTALGLRNPFQDIIIGAIIIAAVTLDRLRQGRLAGG
jgi:ribose transport system permease protein